MAKRGRKPKGAGDVVEKITKATGIKKVVEIFSEATGIDCGCEERKEKLNKLFPYKYPKCMTADQFHLYSEYKATRTKTLSSIQQEFIASLHADLFQHQKYKPCTCDPKAWMTMVHDLDKMHGQYEIDIQDERKRGGQD